MNDILQRITHNANYAMSIIITWIDTPLVSSVWIRGKLDTVRYKIIHTCYYYHSDFFNSFLVQERR